MFFGEIRFGTISILKSYLDEVCTTEVRFVFLSFRDRIVHKNIFFHVRPLTQDSTLMRNVKIDSAQKNTMFCFLFWNKVGLGFKKTTVIMKLHGSP